MKKESRGIVIMVLNIVIMVCNYVVNLVSSQSDTVVAIIEKAVNTLC